VSAATSITGERLAEALEVRGPVMDELRVDQLAAHDRRRHAEEQVAVRPRAHAEVAFGQAGGVGLPGVHDDQRAFGVVGEGLERVRGVVAALADARVGAEDEQEAGVGQVGVQEDRRRGVEHPLVHQVVLGLLLREGVEPAPRTQAAEKAETIGRVHVIRLAADADQADRAGRVLAADVFEPGRDLTDGDVPTDALEPAVGAAPERVLNALRVLDVVRDAEALVADVAVRDRIRLVGPHGGHAAARHVDANAAVVAAEDAHGGKAGGIEREGRAGHGRIDGLHGTHRGAPFSPGDWR
jgi:hypothetical protein